MNIIYSIVTLSLIYSTPIIIAALGGLFSERSGVVNIALEGLMMIGAFSAATTVALLEGSTSFAPWIGLLAGIFFGALISTIHAYVSINLKADQVISGTAINLLAIGLTIYFAQVIFHQQRTDSFTRGFIKTTYPVLKDIPIIGKMLFTNMYVTTYLALILVVVVWYVVYKTVFGLRLRASGEHPQAVDSMGVSVKKMRYIGVILSGALAGLAGAIMVLTQDIQYTIATIHGTGFIALASLIFGKWTPWGVLGAGVFFGFSQVFGIFSGDFEIFKNFPNEFFFALPYLLTIIALVVFSGKSVGPKAAGEPYDVSKR
ncbi:MAG: ABC transporter permease [Clostridiales bacterium]|nr:ABC transporter permease [Clostridiales bacterium]